MERIVSRAGSESAAAMEWLRPQSFEQSGTLPGAAGLSIGAYNSVREDQERAATRQRGAMRRLSAASDVETLAAPASILDVRVVELESLVQSFAGEVELGAVEVRQALRIDDDRDAVRLEGNVLGLELVGEFQLVREPG